jgi:trehalose/maltose hydrolase-like predicted phosphorylase
VLVCGFGGFRVVHGQMSFRPWLPASWEAIHFRLRWRGSRLRVTVDHAGLTFGLDGEPLIVLVHGRPVELTKGTTTVPHEAVPVA